VQAAVSSGQGEALPVVVGAARFASRREFLPVARVRLNSARREEPLVGLTMLVPGVLRAVDRCL
jgi:hypothetical protein